MFNSYSFIYNTTSFAPNALYVCIFVYSNMYVYRLVFNSYLVICSEIFFLLGTNFTTFISLPLEVCLVIEIMWVRVITDFDLFFFFCFLLLNVYLFALTFIVFICFLFFIQIKVKTLVKAYHWEKISKSKIGETS